MPMTARDAVLRALMSYRRDGAWPDKSLGGILQKHELSVKDKALAARILTGVMQNLLLLDFYIGELSSVSLKKIEPRVLDILRMTVYQLVFMEIPQSAAVNEGVKLAKKCSNPKAVGFVNAILRKAADFAKNGGMPEICRETESKRLSLKYSHPEWLVRECINSFGVKDTEAFLKENNSENTPITAQVNRTNTEELLSALEREGVRAWKHEWLDGCIKMQGTGSIERLDAFRRGLFYVQDAAARLSVKASGVKPGDFVIDACAAPGGKSFAAAIEMENMGSIVACDIFENKLRYIEGGAARLGLDIIKTRILDATVPENEFLYGADAVLADVPCSGFGVIRKKPEIRYKSENEIKGFSELQLRILRNLSAYVKSGGVIIYSTCTIFKRENEDIVRRFLSENNGFEPEGFILPGIGTIDSGMITLLPHLHGTDGFFICKLRRKN